MKKQIKYTMKRKIKDLSVEELANLHGQLLVFYTPISTHHKACIKGELYSLEDEIEFDNDSKEVDSINLKDIKNGQFFICGDNENINYFKINGSIYETGPLWEYDNKYDKNDLEEIEKNITYVYSSLDGSCVLNKKEE